MLGLIQKVFINSFYLPCTFRYTFSQKNISFDPQDKKQYFALEFKLVETRYISLMPQPKYRLKLGQVDVLAGKIC